MNEVDTLELGACSVLTPRSDRIDASNSVRFRSACVGQLASGARAVVDLSRVRFIDSSGIGALVAVARHLGEGGRLSLVVTQPSMRSLLEITRIDRIMPIHGDLASATA